MNNDDHTATASAEGVRYELPHLYAADEQALLEGNLERQARLFVARPERQDDSHANVRRFVIADFEYSYDKSRHDGYVAGEGDAAEKTTRWPFHRIAAASWMVIEYQPATRAIVIEEANVIARDVMIESELVQCFFDVLDGNRDAVMITWGGESKDVAALRRSAGELGLILPHHPRHAAPFSRIRLDMCQEVSGGAKTVHLPEYAHATSIPGKPAPSKDVGRLVQAGKWHEVREQALADVLTTSVITLRHLASHGSITCDMAASYQALAAAAAAAMPTSQFVKRSFEPWANHQTAIGKLGGTVYRAA
jgi:hypothetical protein